MKTKEMKMIRSKKYEVKNFILAAMNRGETNLEIVSEMCHKMGKKLDTAKSQVYGYRKVFIESKRTKIVTNLMTGKQIEILASTPYICNPAMEAYWSM